MKALKLALKIMFTTCLAYFVAVNLCQTDGFQYAIALIEYSDGIYRTPLMYAAYSKSSDNIASLLADGYNVNATDSWGRTPLMYAVNNKPEVTRLLLEAGADVNVRDKYGRSALDHALYHETHDDANPEVIALLREAVAAQNKEGLR